MGTEKRARQKANRQARLAEVEAEEIKETREASTKRFGKIAAVVAVLVAIVVLFSVLGGSDDEATTATFQPTPVPEGEPTPVALDASVPDDFVAYGGTRALAQVEPSARAGAYDAPPPLSIDVAKPYIAVIDTDAGEVSVELYPEAAPLTVNNFVNLARDGYYDGTVFHRVLEGFMAQAGDPTATGTGGPGYSFADEVDNGLAFDQVGLLAMANSGSDTNGSQFFITFDVDATAGLTGRHTIFGEVVRNEEVLADITRVDPNIPGSAGDNALTVIESIRIIES